MNNKRLLSPDQLNNNSPYKKQNTQNTQYNISEPLHQNMETSQNTAADVFSWNKLCSLLDDKLKEVAKKEDVLSIKTEIDELREENKQLRNEVKMLSSRIEQIDRRSRCSNVVVRGLVSPNPAAAKSEFNDLCTKKLGVNGVSVVTVRALPTQNTFLFTLETYLQAVNVLAAKEKLKGDPIFIQKDYTKDELNLRYNLRILNKAISKFDTNIKVRLGEFCTYINNKKYTWLLGKVVAYSNDDAEFLKSLLMKANYSVDVIVKDSKAEKSHVINNAITNLQ